ncbi:unnamed protein product [Phytophthora lilii]|uniref:Unnamed protein product n=1 Tax=Phytophthora lilii TaxID=2077276 RepID=A0A9W6TW54_9STRA|nr:unnamed protein product [Phytophthora lilii]
MCVFEPDKRIKISTVVDELARLACAEDKDYNEISTNVSVYLESVTDKLSAAKKLLMRLQSTSQNAESQENAVLFLVCRSIWDNLDKVHDRIHDNISVVSGETFCSLVKDAYASIMNLRGTTTNLESLTETTFQYYSLRRRLGKFIEEHFLSSTQEICYPREYLE